MIPDHAEQQNQICLHKWDNNYFIAQGQPTPKLLSNMLYILFLASLIKLHFYVYYTCFVYTGFFIKYMKLLVQLTPTLIYFIFTD